MGHESKAVPSYGEYVVLGDECGSLGKRQAPKDKVCAGKLACAGFLVFLVLVAAACVTAIQALDQDEQKRLEEFAMLASIPLVALVFTWFHIWLAIQMMFRPLKFFGIWQYADTGVGLGWQGTVPRKSVKMAKTAFRCGRAYLAGPRDWLNRVDTTDMITQPKVREEMEKIVSQSIKDVLRQHQPRLHNELPKTVLEELVALTMTKIEETKQEIWEVIADLLCDKVEGLDNDGMIVTIFTENKKLLNDFFLTMGAREFRFIEHCGAALGFICGLVQLIAFNHLDGTGRLILLPLTGFFLGIVTNWLAIIMCFKPCTPRHLRLFGCHIYTIQGLFLKRQADVAQVYSKMLCDHFFNFDKVMEYLQTQPKLWGRLKAAYMAHSTRILHATAGRMLVLAKVALGRDKFGQLEDDLNMAMVVNLSKAVPLHNFLSGYLAKACDIERTNTEAVRDMPPDKFEDLLHPVFQEDEWILVLLGGILGAIVGIAQVYFLST